MSQHALRPGTIPIVDALLGETPRAAASSPPFRRASSAALEAPASGEALFDYVLAPYEPAAPLEGSVRAVALLHESFAVAGFDEPGQRLIERLRAHVGLGKTVFGIKHRDGELSWELYLYDPARARPELSTHAVARAANLALDRAVPTDVLTHMVSLDVSAGTLGEGSLSGVHLYVNGAEQRGSSRSYQVQADGKLRLENLYTFHDPKREADEIIARLEHSTHLGGAHIAAALWPELWRCRRICVANKPGSDGMYFSGVSTAQSTFFLERMAWPAQLQGLMRALCPHLQPIRWDVGFDFERGEHGPRIEKSALYATF